MKTPASIPFLAITFALLALNPDTLKQAHANEASANITTKPVGTATRAWLNEQREGRNRAEPEPYPAERGMALRRYENSFVNPTDGTSATRSGTAIGIRSGSVTNATGGTPGMTR